jgi:dsRNA-specific ribonuclease
VSSQLFATHRQYHEGQLTKRKELVVANIHLAEAAVKVRPAVMVWQCEALSCSRYNMGTELRRAQSLGVYAPPATRTALP